MTRIDRSILSPRSKGRSRTESKEIIGPHDDPILTTTVLNLLTQDELDDHVVVRVTIAAMDGSELIYSLHTPEVGELADDVEDWAHHIHEKLTHGDVSEQEIRLWHKMMESDPNWRNDIAAMIPSPESDGS